VNEPDRLAGAKDAIQKTLRLPSRDATVIDFVLSLAVVNTWFADVEPVWGFVVGPPGSAKTEVLRTLEGWEYAHFVDELTENALASGFESDDGEDPSLLPKLNGRILILRDFSSLTGTHRDTLTKVLGVLRAAYDGSYTKAGGMSGIKSYTSKFGVIIATTPVFDTVLSANQQLGERFVTFRMMRGEPSLEDRMLFLEHVQTRMDKKTAWRATLRETIQGALSAIRLYTKEIKPSSISLSPAHRLVLRMMADMVCRLRTRPHGDTPAEAEVASRFVQQLTNMVLARAACCGRMASNDEDIAFARRLACDSLPDPAYRIMDAFYRKDIFIGHRITDLVRTARLSMDIVSSLVHQYHYLHLVSAVEGHGSTSYCLEDETIEQVAATGLFNPPERKN